VKEVVEVHAVIRANVTNVQIFAKVAVKAHAVVHVNHWLKEKIQLDLSGNLK